MNAAAIIALLELILPWAARAGEYLIGEASTPMTPEQRAARSKEIRDAIVKVDGDRDRLRLRDWSGGRL
ncbi:MAG: hypothetical protein WC700_19485 [Gemmatimonadaceae bacterium]